METLKVVDKEAQHTYRAGFSQYIQKKKAVEEFNLLRPYFPSEWGLPERLSEFPKDFDKNDAYKYFREDPPESTETEELKVCIIGAGAAGMFTALLFDYLKGHEDVKLNVTYDILEASDAKKRKGGRLYTYNFPKRKRGGVYDPVGEHDYYDVGAMRFPDAPQMKRLFRLFKFLEMEHGKSNTKKRGELIPYYMHSKWEDGNCYDPYYFNRIKKTSVEIPNVKGDPFRMNETSDRKKRINKHALKLGPDVTLGKVIKRFLHKNDLYEHDENNVRTRDEFTKNYNVNYDKLWEFDQYSTRSYLQGKSDFGPGFNYFTIQWLETFAAGTGWYDQAWLETVLEYLDFNPITPDDEEDKDHCSGPKEEEPNPWDDENDDAPIGEAPKNEATSYDWFCIYGGAGQLIEKMEKRMKQKVSYEHRVTKIETRKDGRPGLKVSSNNPDGTRPKEYSAVFASPPLGCMRRIDLDSLDTLEYETRLALRCLTYGPSTKVGIKFRSAWWRQDKFKIGLGGVAYTDANLRMCVYPSYELEEDEPAVLIASYAWSQDAMRMSTLISDESPKNEQILKDLLFHELAKLHAKSESKEDYQIARNEINEQYLDHYAWSWYSGDDSTGAFAFFGPGQYSSLWPALTQREAHQQLYFIGEHTSAFHAWVVGAIDSAQRAVYQFCEAHGFVKAMEVLKKLPEDKKEAEKYPFAPLPPDYDDRIQRMRHKLLLAKIAADVDPNAEFKPLGVDTPLAEMIVKPEETSQGTQTD